MHVEHAGVCVLQLDSRVLYPCRDVAEHAFYLLLFLSLHSWFVFQKHFDIRESFLCVCVVYVLHVFIKPLCSVHTKCLFCVMVWVCAGLAEQAGWLQHAPAAGKQGVWE